MMQTKQSNGWLKMDEQQYPERGVWMTHSRTGNDYQSLGRGKLKFGGVWYDAVFYENTAGERFARTVDDFGEHFVELGQ